MDFSLLVVVIAALAGVLLGVVLAGYFARARNDAARALAAAQAESAKAPLEERLRGLEGQLAESRVRREAVEAEFRALRMSDAEKAAHIRELETRLAAEQKSYAENQARLKALVEDTEKRFTSTFEALASKILEEKTARFTETNRTKLDELLVPFRERLKEFQKKVEDTHLTDVAERRSLKDQLESLHKLNQQIGEDARNLTNALKGESKTQGTWGEMILERTLELSGLVKGRDYEVQVSTTGEDGDRLQPDVVVHLPDNRHLVVDSKVSLVAFERYASAATDEERQAALAAHLVSVRTHIRSLSEKNYPKALGATAMDFTLMFIAVEPAFLAAVQADPTIYDTAWKQKIVLVGPTTLLATLRVVESIWRLDRQNRNALKIAEQGGRLYDAFVMFMKDLEKAAKSVKDAGASLDSAVHRAHAGRGNLVRGFEEMKKMGAKTSRELPAQLLEITDDSEADPSGDAENLPTSTGEPS